MKNVLGYWCDKNLCPSAGHSLVCGLVVSLEIGSVNMGKEKGINSHCRVDGTVLVYGVI